MKLYQLPFSHYSAKVRIMLLEKRLIVELPEIPGGSTDSEEYRQINATGLVPCLVDGDVMLGESEVIAEYLEEAYPAISMLPVSAAIRARSRWLSRMHDLQIAPQLSLLYGLSLEENRNNDVINSELAQLHLRLDMIEQAISPEPYFFGDQFGISDASYVLSTWYAMILSEMFGEPLTEERYPKLIEWFDSVSARTSAMTVLMDCKRALGMVEDRDRHSA
ncbi:MAG: glutathione S-transferase family protein [Gammaproteobacteria bacterium]|nr:glutathione S-transferase family protein [Gammaproteobacteria bacterium]